MVSFEQAIGNLTDKLISDRKQAVEEQIAAEMTNQAQEFSTQATMKLLEDYESSEPGAFDFDAQQRWYDDESSKILNKLDSDTDKARMKNVLARRRESFSTRAYGLSIQSIKEKETDSIDNSYSSFVLNTRNKNIDPLDALDDYLDANDISRSVYSKDSKVKLDARESKAVYAAAQAKIDRITQAGIEGKIAPADIQKEIEAVSEFIINDPRMKRIDGEVLASTFDALDNLKSTQMKNYQTILETATKTEYNAYLNDLSTRGEVALNPATEEAYLNNLKTPIEKERAMLQIKAYHARASMTTAMQVGDFDDAEKTLDGLDTARRDPSLSANQREDLRTVYEEAKKAMGENRQLIFDSAGEFFNNNPQVKSLYTEAKETGDYSRYAAIVTEMAVRAGVPFDNVHLLPKNELLPIQEQLKSKDIGQLFLTLNDLQAEYGNVEIYPGATMFDHIVKQVSEGDSATKIPFSLRRAFKYVSIDPELTKDKILPIMLAKNSEGYKAKLPKRFKEDALKEIEDGLKVIEDSSGLLDIPDSASVQDMKNFIYEYAEGLSGTQNLNTSQAVAEALDDLFFKHVTKKSGMNGSNLLIPNKLNGKPVNMTEVTRFIRNRESLADTLFTLAKQYDDSIDKADVEKIDDLFSGSFAETETGERVTYKEILDNGRWFISDDGASLDLRVRYSNNSHRMIRLNLKDRPYLQIPIKEVSDGAWTFNRSRFELDASGFSGFGAL